jgi:AcrR family transcriptional regulator
MPVPRKRRGRPARRDVRALVLAAAARRFAQHGYEAVTVEDLIQAARVSRTLFYKHFDSREDVLVELYREGIERIRDQVVEAIGVSSDLAEMLERGVERYFAAIAAAGPLAGELMRLQYGNPRLYAIREKVVADYRVAIRERLARGRRPLLPDLLIDAGLMAIDRIAQRMVESGSPPDLEVLRPALRALSRRAEK